MLRRLDRLEALRPLLPVVHDRLGLALLSEDLTHLLHLLLAFLDVVDTDIGDEWDAGTHGGRGSGLAVFNRDALLRLDAELLARVDVDGWIWLGGWRVEGRSSGVDVVVSEEACPVKSVRYQRGPLSTTGLRIRLVFSREATTRGLAEVETTAIG